MKCILLAVAIICLAQSISGFSDFYEAQKKLYKQEKKLYQLSLDAAERARETEYEAVRKYHLKKKEDYADSLAFTVLSFDDDRYQYGGCTCEMLICTCCGRIEVGRANLNDTACITLEYNNTNKIVSYDFTLKPLLDGFEYNNTFSASNIVNPCFNIDESEQTKICLSNYNFYTSFNDYMAQGCVEMKVTKGSEKLAQIRIGCYSMFYQIGHSNFIKDVISSHSQSGESQYLSRSNPFLKLKLFLF